MQLQGQAAVEVCRGMVSNTVAVITVFLVKYEGKVSSQMPGVESVCWINQCSSRAWQPPQ